MAISPKPASGESARFHLSDYRLVAGYNLPGAGYPPPPPILKSGS
jgi:hypothetical protein